MSASLNLDLFSAGFTIAASLILGFVVFYKDRKSATNRLFLFFTLTTSGWSIFNYLSYQVSNSFWALWTVRLVMFFAVYQAFIFFLLMHTFPGKKIMISRRVLLTLLFVVGLVSMLTLTPAVFSSVKMNPGQAPEPIPAPGILLFAFVAISSVVVGIFLLVKKITKALKEERWQYFYLLLGVIIMFSLIIVFNFIYVAVFGNSSFVPLSALFVLPFVVLTSYAIIKHQLLDIKIIGTEILMFVLIVVTFVEVILSSSIGEVVLRVGIFFALLIVGVLLIRSVISEVKHRERLQELTKKLRDMDKQKDEFISMAAHELRAPMTAIKGYISMVVGGDAGKITDKARSFLGDANTINERVIRLVNNMLNVSRIEERRMVYQMEVENLSQVTRAVFSQFRAEAEKKGLKFSLTIPREIKDKVEVDPDRIHEVLANFLSNAVKYTDKGSVEVKLGQPNASTVRLEVIDTGPGISKEEQTKLFKKFSRIESSVGKTTGTGLGLYICKLLVEKFKGKIGLESEAGKGSTFWFELPLAKSGK
jgi:signal transduction histidine kinase